jgi:hypothetical protein
MFEGQQVREKSSGWGLRMHGVGSCAFRTVIALPEDALWQAFLH